MFKFDNSLKVALILIIATTLVHSQDYPTLIGKGKPIITEASRGVLYEQMTDFGPSSLNSQNFETMYDVYDSQASDDFVIPVEDDTWTIESVEVLGVYYNGTGPATSVNVWFYNDSGGFPDTIVAGRLNEVPTGGLSTGSFVINLTSPITLQAGTYWLSVQCNMDSAIGGQWGWTEQQQSNLESTWQNPGGGWITSCVSWGYRVTDCNLGVAPYYDLSFRLSGYTGDPCPVEVAFNPSPSNDSTNVPIAGVSLGWTNGIGTENVEVWFGPDERVLKLYDGTAITSWPLGTLSFGTLYRWYIVCKDDTCGIQGPDWTFTTMQDTNLVIDTIDIYPKSLNNWTGTCNSSSKTQVSLVNGIDTELGWMVFDVSVIPNNVSINSVTFNGYLYDNSWPYWSITPMGNINPVTDPASAIYNQVSSHSGQGVAYSYNIESATLSNNWLTRPLGSTVTADLQSALAKNWFAIGILDFDFSTSYYVKFHGWAEANKPYLKVIYSFLGQTTFQLALDVDDGWNMVSIPGLNSPDQNVNTWWPYRDPAANVWRYVSGFGYFSTSSVIPGKGYWMKHLGARFYNTGDEWPAEGINIVRHDPVNVVSGWNIFGGYEEIVPTAGLTTTPPGLISGPVYGYSGGYFIPANLEPGHGYWVKLTGDGQIIIPDALAKGNREVTEWFKDDWGRITITDVSGKSITLYSVDGEVDLEQYELPPAPPAGNFDIRFESGRIAEDIKSAIKTITMSGVTYPLTVRVEGMDMRLMDETGNTINANLKSGEDVVISDATIQKLMVTGELIPAVYALEQNYPNPFNPSTTIEFSLPEDVSNVKLSIYNALGERVAELVNGSLVAGKYQYQWNAKNVATGMYIYELRTGKFVSMKKMVLLK